MGSGATPAISIMTTIALEQVLSRGSDILDCNVGDDVIVLSMQTGMYYAFDPTAARIWTLLETPMTFGALCDRLTEEYEVEPDTCRADVAPHLQTLMDDALVLATAPGA